jgi:hypothetical protein
MVASLNMILAHVAEHFDLKMDDVVRVALECPAFKAPSQKTTKSGAKKEPREPVPPLSEWSYECVGAIADLTKEELKVLLKEAGQRVGGKKGELAARFEGYLNGDAETGAPKMSPRFAKKSNDPIELTDCTTAEELEALSAKALRTMCTEYGLAKSGKKPVLVTRLVEFAAAGPNDSGDENADADANADSESEPELAKVEDVTDESELDGFPAGALKAFLQSYSLRTSGKKSELKERVWRALNEESAPEDYPKKRGRSASPRANDSENDSE